MSRQNGSGSIPLTSQVKKLNIVIRKNKAFPKSVIEAYLNDNFSKWAYIEHKGDIEPTTKTEEGVHYHIVGYHIDNKTPKSTKLNVLAKHFKLDNTNGVEIEKIVDEIGSLQYLIHKNNPEKTQHDINEVVYKGYTEEELLLYMQADRNEVISYDYLYATIMSAHNILDVIKALGLKNYKENRNVIWDMWKCIRDLANGNTNSEYFM